MEYLRNLPSKTNAFSAATYEKVRSTGHAQNRPFFTTVDQTPHQVVLPSNDENLILAAIRHKKQVTARNTEQQKRPSTPTGSETGTPQPPRLYKRPRIALSNAAAASSAARAAVTTAASAQSSSSSSSPSLSS